MTGRRAAWEALKAFLLVLWYGITGDWRYNPKTQRYWPSGRRG